MSGYHMKMKYMIWWILICIKCDSIGSFVQLGIYWDNVITYTFIHIDIIGGVPWFQFHYSKFHNIFVVISNSQRMQLYSFNTQNPLSAWEVGSRNIICNMFKRKSEFYPGWSLIRNGRKKSITKVEMFMYNKHGFCL